MTADEHADKVIASVVQYVRLGEQLRQSIVQLTHVVYTLREVHETDDELAPELLVALAGITGAAEALERAEVFATTRLEVALSDE